MLDYLIIGAGMTGVSLARLLQLRGGLKFHVLEAAPQAGGLCRSEEVNGHHLDLGGGHFLCTKHPRVYDFIFSHLPREEFNHFTRVSKIRLAGGWEVDYPLESNLWQLPAEAQVEFLLACMRSGEASGCDEPANYEAWLRWKLGARISEDYLLPYNRKIWGVEPQEMDVDWLHKIPRLDVREMLRSCLTHCSDRAKMPSHQDFLYPRRGGFQSIFDAVYAPVRDHISVASPVVSLRRLDEGAGGGWLVNGEHRCRHLVNTAPWHRLQTAFGPADATRLAPYLPRLRTNSVVVSLLEQPFEHDWHWCYLPDPKIAHHREFFIRNFAPHSRRDGVYIETNRQRWVPHDRALCEHTNEDAYPIPVLGHARAIRSVLEICRPWRLYGLGRWGQHNYFNSDVCIHEAMQFVEHLPC